MTPSSSLRCQACGCSWKLANKVARCELLSLKCDGYQLDEVITLTKSGSLYALQVKVKM
jgi:hypothetical protein